MRSDSLRAAPRRDALGVMVDVQEPDADWRARAEEHRQMARAAIRVALRHGIPDREIEAEYDAVRRMEASRNV